MLTAQDDKVNPRSDTQANWTTLRMLAAQDDKVVFRSDTQANWTTLRMLAAQDKVNSRSSRALALAPAHVHWDLGPVAMSASRLRARNSRATKLPCLCWHNNL